MIKRTLSRSDPIRVNRKVQARMRKIKVAKIQVTDLE